MRPIAHQAHVGIEFALKHLTDENRRFARDDVADQEASKARGELGGIVASLVGVPENHERRIHFADQFLGGGGVSVGRIGKIDRVRVEVRSKFFRGGQNFARHALFDDREDAHRYPRLETQFFYQLRSGGLRVAIEDLPLLVLFRRVESFDDCRSLGNFSLALTTLISLVLAFLIPISVA